MWMRRRTVRIEMEQVTLRVDGHAVPMNDATDVDASPPVPALNALDRFLQLHRNRALPKPNSASDRKGSK